MAQRPSGPDNLLCPFHRRKMSRVCATCPLYVCVRGTNPNTGAEVDEWNCALAFLPMLLIENAQQSRQAGAAIESFRNETVRAAQQRVDKLGELLEKVASPLMSIGQTNGSSQR